MKYCTKLFREINFEPAAISPCCNVHGIKIPSYPYAGGPLDMKKYAAHIQNVTNELQSPTELCAGCADLESDSAPGVIAAIRFTAVSINMHRFFCNCKCVYCNLWQDRSKGFGYDILPGLQSLHGQRVLEAGCLISWGGGEPCILPGFDKTSEWAMEHGYSQYIHTNAIRFSPAVAVLLKNGNGGINVSLDSSSAEMYQAVKGVNQYSNVINNIRRYAEEGDAGGITLKYIVFEKNNKISEIDGFLEFCSANGIQNVQLSLNFVEVNADKVSANTLLAAAFFIKKAQKLNLKCVPVFIADKYIKKIADFTKKL